MDVDEDEYEDVVWDAPLPDNEYSPGEKVVIWGAIGIGLIAMAGLILAFDTVWTDTLKPIIWDPRCQRCWCCGGCGIYPTKYGHLHPEHAFIGRLTAGDVPKMEPAQ